MNPRAESGDDARRDQPISADREERAARRELAESEERLRFALETARMGAWTYHTGTDAMAWSPQAAKIYSRSPDEMPKTMRESINLMHPDDGAIALQRLQSGNELGGPGREYRVRLPDGAYRWIAGLGDVSRNAAGVLSGVIMDIHERKVADNALLASEARFRSLVDNSPDFITRVGPDLRHDFVNLTAQQRAGLDPNVVLGKTAAELGFDPGLGELFMARQQDVFETGERVEYEYPIHSLASPDAVSYRRARLIPEFDEEGNVQHVLSIVTDITAQRKAEEERKRLDQQMQHAQKLESLGVLAGGIAHEFNNLLVAMLGNAGLALMELPPESPARQTVQAIELAAQRASELTRQMLAYSGKGRFIIEPLNLSRVVEEMAHLLEVTVSKRAVLKYRFPAELPVMEGDATQVRQVIMNLIMNASDAIGERSGVISLSTGAQHADHAYLSGAYVDEGLPEGEYIYLEVADTGGGMDEETKARIFDPFFTTKFTGRGLGLAAVLGIVRGHRGAIKLYSEPGRGTTFKVLFPLADGAGGAGSAKPLQAAGAAEASGRTILVIDDDQTVRAVSKRILEHAGFTVVLGADGLHGLETYKANPEIALVLLDMTMPHMDGEETFRELRRVDPAVRVLLTSGYNEQDATERFAGKGLSGFIQKPYRPQELLDKIYEALG